MEFALVLPLVALLLFGLIEFGKAFSFWIDQTHLANQAGRYASVNTYDSQPINTDGPPPVDNVAAFETAIEQQADTQELRDTIDVHVCFPSGSGGAVGDPVKVEVSSPFTGWTKIVPGLPDDLSASVTMRIEKAYPNGFATDPSRTC